MHHSPRLLAALVAAAAVPALATGQSLILDLAPVPSGGAVSSAPSDPVVVNGRVFFTADGPWGRELYVTDGSSAGTRLLKDLGTNGSSNPQHLTPIGSELLFTASVAGLGRELWKTDGTAAGTVLVKDIAEGGASSNPSGFATLGGVVYFGAYDGTDNGLWVTDGTAAGTTLAFSTGSALTELTASGSTLFFILPTVAYGTELWKSDGTLAGTAIVADLEPVGSSAPTQLTPFLGGVLFSATRVGFGTEPHFSDGTAAGTLRLADLFVGGGGSNPTQFTPLGGLAVFVANDSGTPSVNDVFVTDGTVAGTTLLAGGVNASWLTAFQSHVYFRGVGAAGAELYRTDGTVAGTGLFADLAAGSSSPHQLAVVGSELWFAADGGGGVGIEPWKTDGTLAGTQLVRDVNPAGSSLPHDMVLLGGDVVCGLTDGSAGDEPSVVALDGSAHALLADVAPTSSSSTPDRFQAFPGGAFFTATSQSIGDEAFWTDGTAAGTVGVDVWAGANGSNPREPVAIGSEAFFSAAIGTDRELWKSDGSPFGTVQLSDPLGLASTNPTALAAVNGRVVFRGLTPGNGFELMSSDGTTAGTGLIQDITAGVGNTTIATIVSNGTRAVFAAFQAGVGSELWSTDGTAAGTSVLDLLPGATSSAPSDLVAADGAFYFAANGTVGRLLWKTDGTLAGTTSLAAPSNPFALTPSGTRVFGRGTFAGIGQELFVSDGTAAGTVGIDLKPGLTSSTPQSLTGAAGGVFFLFDDLTGSGTELWFSDGTAAGTDMVLDIAPGYANGPVVGTLVPIMGQTRVAFVANDLQHGLQLWISDGTAAGTTMATGFGGDGVGAAAIGEVFGAGAQVFFAADEGSAIGVEPYSLVTGLPFALPYGTGCAGPGKPVPAIGSSGGPPSIGNAAFAVTVASAEPLSLAPLFLGFGPANASLGGACRLLVQLPVDAFSVAITDALGEGSVWAPLPNDPTVVGVSVFFQYGVVSPTAPFLNLLDLSDALHVQIGG